MRVHVGNASAPAKRNYPLIEPWTGERLAGNRVHQDTVCKLSVATLSLRFNGKEKFGVKRQNNFFLPFSSKPLNLFRVEV